MFPSDDELTARIRQGQTPALMELLEAHRAQLLGFVERKMSPGLRRKIDPEDVLQEAISHCARAFQDMEPAELEPLAWIHQVAERRIIDAHRKFFGTQKRAAGREVALGGGATASRPALIDMLVASFTSPSQAFARGQREQKLVEAMQRLSEEQRDLLRMRYIEELPTKQIAEQMDKTDGAIRVMLTRSLKRLEQLLEGQVLE